jgi:ABC-type multidrug transport system fused ATPase/permease subunit
MIYKIKFLFSILNKKQKKRFFLLLSFMVLSSFLEILSVVSLIDFVNFLSFDSSGKNFGFFEKIFNLLNLDYQLANIQLFTYFIITILILSTLSSLLTIYLSARFSYITGGEIEGKLFNYYLNRDYLFHLDTTS